jgi:hypothetical protein
MKRRLPAIHLVCKESGPLPVRGQGRISRVDRRSFFAVGLPVRGFILADDHAMGGQRQRNAVRVRRDGAGRYRCCDVIVVLAKPKPVSDTQFVSVPAWAGVSCGWTLGVLSSFRRSRESRTPKQAAGIAARKEKPV